MAKLLSEFKHEGYALTITVNRDETEYTVTELGMTVVSDDPVTFPNYPAARLYWQAIVAEAIKYTPRRTTNRF
ncbi:hypothetical protein [Cupriavidus sp. DF5525]|uniref:hypothetical protein n=1 Tax=Cupriavidus sp. DF5525 TaxID=3160989 RepID=UPI0032DFBF1F